MIFPLVYITIVYVGVTETDVQPTTDSEYIAIGAGVGAAVIVVATTTVVILLVLLVLFVKSKRGIYSSFTWTKHVVMWVM